MHFLKQIIENPNLKNPAKEHMNIHRHFYRYSKGIFIGPAIEIRRTASKISFKGSLEYEDIIQEIVLKTIPDSNVNIEGVLISGADIKDLIRELGVDWVLKASKGKTKNYKALILEEIGKEKLLKIIEELRKNSYLLVSFNSEDKTYKLTTNKRLPGPSKKKPVDDDVAKRIGFCKGDIINNTTNLEIVLDELLYDFKSELPEKWKKITILNNYKINELEIPKDIKNSAMLRIMAIRKGKLIRTAQIDEESVEKQYSIVV